ncbi:MAG: HAMP domain-containing histidine kinase [Myxacorys chilensis ATA2-1-KO14]|jgi:PAS domain S-box-containing protein|nr:HAMP domain-containing histidine kinase [Myxacorys chilensis ATA2-1-KO14]
MKVESGLFDQQIQAVHQRAKIIDQAVKKMPGEHSQILVDCLEELHVSLEELQVAQEEIREQQNNILEAQHIIEAERQRYQELFEFAPDGYLVTDQFGTVREANRAAVELLKVSSKHLIGKPLLTFVPEENRQAFRAILNHLPVLRRIQEWEVQLRSREQRFFEAAITVETVRNDGQTIGLRWLIRDITERKQAEEQLHQTKLQNVQLIEADRLRQQFMATVTHELRTPMNAILGFSDLLMRQFRAQGQVREITMLERVLKNGQHLLMLIEDILDFSKLQANRLELNLQAVDASELISAIVEELQPLADQKHIQLQFCVPSAPIAIVNDPLRVRQIVINLISNAIKFTDVGRVFVEVLELPEGRFAIVVGDTGIGIDTADQSQIFREFWQVNQTNTRSQGGTGLGLSITKALVELMQGGISVESQLGAGTTFRVELPCRIPVKNQLS